MKKLFVIFLVLFCFYHIFPQEITSRVLRGKVINSLGSPIENAEIKIISDSGKSFFCQNKTVGEFTCEMNFEGNFLLTVRAEGFSILRQNFDNVQDFTKEYVLTLSPESLNEKVVVTANRTETRIGETAASVVSLSKLEIQTSAAPTVDDVLRQVPGF